MQKSDSQLPDFKNPPVIEVVLSAQFEPLLSFSAAQFGRLWERYRKEFPETEDKPALSRVFERFEAHRPAFELELGFEPKPIRCWFKNKNESELIQVQRDRFIFNWKRDQEDQSYPRFDYIRNRFVEHFRTFESFLKESGLGEAKPNQCEVTYINHLVSGQGWNHFGQFEHVFSVWSGSHSMAPWLEPEQVSFRCQYVMTKDGGEPFGRLQVSAQPQRRLVDDSPIIQLELTTRGTPLGEDLDGVLKCFEFGHALIVRGFAAITTPKMHRIWERTDGK